MTYRGHVKNGLVVFDGPVVLPDGAEVRIEPVVEPRKTTAGELPLWPGKVTGNLTRTEIYEILDHSRDRAQREGWLSTEQVRKELRVE